MSEPIVLSASCSPESGNVFPSLSCAGRLLCDVEPGSPVAVAVADFIRRRFRQAYDALPVLRIPRLLALTTSHGSLLAAVGVRNARSERLFLEDYTDLPIEQLIPAAIRPERERIAEIAHLAGVEPGVSRYLFPALTVWLKSRHYQWVAFTGTEQLRNSFQRLGIRTYIVAEADPGRLQDGGRGWGRYYDNRPMVMVANVNEGCRALQASGQLARIRPWGRDSNDQGWGDMTALPEIIARRAELQPEAIALQSPEQSVSYRQLWAEVTSLAAQLTASGFRRFGLCGDNSIGWVMADLACRLAGVVCVPVPGFFSTAQVDHLTARAGLDALLMPRSAQTRDDRLNDWVGLQPLPATPGAVAMPAGTGKITFTSGSTGTPKGVCLAHQQLDATVAALAGRLADVPIRRHLCLLPLATLLENIAGVYLPLSLGATVMVWPLAQLGFNGSSELNLPQLADTLSRCRPDSLILVPELATVLVRGVELGLLNADSFRFLAVGGGRVSPTMLDRGRRLGLPLYEGYGLSECGSVVALNVPGADRPGTVGQPLEHVAISLSAEDEICVRGNTFLGYLGAESASGESLATGDLGSFDEDGYLRVSGRRKNLIITSFGRNISPEWLESELQQRVGVRQAFVFGDGDPGPSALVVAPADRSAESIHAAVRQLNESLPDYARLRTLYLQRAPLTRVDGHLTANGRLVRHQLLADLPRLLPQAEFATLFQTATDPLSVTPDTCTQRG